MRDEPIDRYATIALARWLREWRTMTGVTQRSVARLAGIDQGGLSRIERGLEGRPSGWRLARILVVLDWLSGGGDPGGPWAELDRLRPDRLPPDTGPKPPPIVGRRPRPGHDEDDW
jgi:DNA-binding XRE family transcriptional regulator